MCFVVFCRYACIHPHGHRVFCTIIHEFGKKGDMMSALTVFEASKQKLSGPNMYAYHTIIDVCGLCGDYLKSRSIYENCKIITKFAAILFDHALAASGINEWSIQLNKQVERKKLRE
ncbi:hypothetical protein RHGRI_011638 [Rhododendron griersonianum]|uniref:Pentatricopeptide repeat-containing protein n=1 Tax=Rhododendron griersonianum TaxID=479676 RepID=A0AAV6KN24_9ERIC|nr:hypothetical protein RHGRI_011638 [Rhododendron griersonianum]